MNKIFLSIVILVTFTRIYAQDSKIDSLNNALSITVKDTTKVNIYCELANALSRNKTEEALNYTDSALILSKKINYKIGIADAYLHKGSVQIYLGLLDSSEININKSFKIYSKIKSVSGQLMALSNLSTIELYRGNIEKAISIANKALIISKKTNNQNKTAKIYNNIGLMQYYLGAYDSSITYTFNALKIFKKLNNKEFIKGCYINIGNSFTAINDTSNAFEYLYKATSLCTELNDKRGLSITYSGLANLYLMTNELDTAYSLLTEALKIDKINNDIQGQSINLKTIAKVLVKQKKYSDAYNKLIEGADLQKQIGDKNGLIVTNFDIAYIFYQQERYKEAEPYSLKSYNLAHDLKSKDQERLALEQLSNIYLKLNNYEKAFLYLNKSLVLKDSIFNIDKQKEIDKLNIQYQTTEKDKENQKLEFENKLKDTQIKNERNQKYAILLGLLLLIIVLYFVIRNFKQRKKHLELQITNKAIEENLKGQEQERTKIAEELHDDIGGNLASTKLIVESVLTKNPSLTELEKVSKAIDESYKYIRLSSHQLAHFSKMNKTLIEGVEDFISSIQHTKTAIITYKNNLNISLSKINEGLKIDIYRTIQELIINAIKHAKAKNITLLVSNKENILKIVVLDDGIGFTDSNKKGVGLSNINDRLNKLNGKININSEVDEGTTINIEIPINRLE